MAKDPKKELKKMSAPTRTIDYQVDTLQTAEFAAAYFLPDRNTVTINYVKGEDNSFNESRSTKAHEQKHRDNNAAGMKNLPMSLEQYYKVCCHDEVSATICELLEVREAYKAAKTPQARAKIVKDNSKFDYYFEAIKNGEINPLSSKSADFDKEMEFIGKKVGYMWKVKYAEEYDQDHLAMTEYFLNHHDFSELKQNDANYKKALKIAYTIGGIDFSKYIRDDLTYVNDNAKEADKLIARGVLRQEIKKILTAKTSLYGDNPKLAPIKLPDEPTLSVRQQQRLAEHQLFVRNLVKRFDFSEFITEKNESKTNANNINTAIDWFNEDINKNFPKLQKAWQKETQKIADDIVMQNQQLFLPSGDDELYKKKLREIYTINGVCFLDYYKKDIEKVVPRGPQGAITALENLSFADRAKKKATEIKNKVVNKGKQMLSGEGLGALKDKVVNKGKQLLSGEGWGALKDKIIQKGKQWLNGTEEENNKNAKTEENNKNAKAEKNNKNAQKEFSWTRYKGKPLYSTWSPEERVSPVLSAEITDFTKPFLKQEQEQKQLAEAKTKSAVSNAKFTAKVANKKPDAVRAKKAPKKPAAKKQEPSVLDNVIDNINQGVNMIWTKLKNFTR